MLRLDLPFYLTADSLTTLLRSDAGEFSRRKGFEVILEGMSISLETRGKIYSVNSDQPPQSDYSSRLGGVIWPRWQWRLAEEISIEQQMLLPVGGNALAISWRLIGAMFLPVRLEARPVFSTRQRCVCSGFQVESETSGGRLTWRPYDRSSKIIADTNGLLVEQPLPIGARPGPSTFQFELGPRPAVLIISSEWQHETGLDPLIGGFLADLTAQRATPSVCRDQRNLVAA